MDEENTAPTGSTLDTFYAGWANYQRLIITALAPLPPDQLALHAGDDLRSIELIARHMVGARARWMHGRLGEGGADVAALAHWDWDPPDGPTPTADALIAGLHTTWRCIEDSLRRWTPAAMTQTFTRTRGAEVSTVSRQWVIWHLIEHDLHHGGEISLTLGMHGLAAPDL
jgi:uncharacterized damage-inducible protein DinB